MTHHELEAKVEMHAIDIALLKAGLAGIRKIGYLVLASIMTVGGTILTALLLTRHP